MSLQLRECPWCRSPGDLLGIAADDFDSRHVSAVECSKCGARGPEVSGVTRDEARQRAFDAWGYK